MKTALVVDDSMLVRCLVKELLSEQGLQTVAEAGDAQEAIKAYRSHRPDLVTLDLTMSGAGSGIDVLHDIRRQNPQAKVVIVTESREENIHREALAGGAAAVLCKPISAADFKTALALMGPLEGAKASPKPVKRRALVVDDSPVMRALVSDLLTEQGIDVIGEAGDVPEGIDAYGRLRPDLVTLDMVMPGGSGADVLKAIRAKNPSAQVMMLTSVTQEKVKAELLELGACAVIAKPLTSEKFRAVLGLAPAPAAASSPASAAPAGPLATGAAALKAILAAGDERARVALSALFKSPWAVTEEWIHEGAPTAGAIGGILDAKSESIAVRLTVQGEMPAICLFLADRVESEKIAWLLAPGSLSADDGDVARLVAMEWANVLLTNILNAFADARGGAILSSTPEFDEAPVVDLVAEAMRKLKLEPAQAFLARSRFACAGVGSTCDTLLVLPAESVRRLFSKT